MLFKTGSIMGIFSVDAILMLESIRYVKDAINI